MRRGRYLKKENKKVIVDMNDFLVTYGAEILGEESQHLAQRIYQAGATNLKGLDQLFHDHGFGRKQKYINIAEGFVRDLYSYQGSQVKAAAHHLTRAAMRNLGAHANKYNYWKQA